MSTIQKDFMDFQTEVDLDGILTQAMQMNNLLHTPKNEIMYYENCSVDRINQSEIRHIIYSNTNNRIHWDTGT